MLVAEASPVTYAGSSLSVTFSPSDFSSLYNVRRLVYDKCRRRSLGKLFTNSATPSSSTRSASPWVTSTRVRVRHLLASSFKQKKFTLSPVGRVVYRLAPLVGDKLR